MLQTISRCSGRIGRTFLPILCRAVPRAECADGSRADFLVWFTSEVVLSMSEIVLFFSEVGKSSSRALLSRARALLWVCDFFLHFLHPFANFYLMRGVGWRMSIKKSFTRKSKKIKVLQRRWRQWRQKTCTIVGYTRARHRKTVRNVCRNKTFRTVLKK